MKLPPQEALTEEEVRQLLQQTYPHDLQGLRDFCILRLMLYTGLRRAEVASLKVGSLAARGNNFWLVVFGKGEKYRTIPIEDDKLITSIWEYQKKVGSVGKKEAPMFYTLSKRGGRPIQAITSATVRRVVEKYSKPAGITKRVSSHTLRHTFASKLFHKGAASDDVRDLMGHRSIETTNRYAHTTEERKRAAIKGLTY